MESVLQAMRAASNGSYIDGYGYVIGYDVANALRSIAAIIDSRGKLVNMPSLKLNVVRYFYNGVLLEQPIISPSVYVQQENGAPPDRPELLCYMLEPDSPDGEQRVKVALDRVTSVAFKRPGIWIEGLQIVMAAPSAAGGYALPMLRTPGELQTPEAKQRALANEVDFRATYVYQRLLLTNMCVTELLHRNFFAWWKEKKEDEVCKGCDNALGPCDGGWSCPGAF